METERWLGRPVIVKALRLILVAARWILDGRIASIRKGCRPLCEGSCDRRHWMLGGGWIRHPLEGADRFTVLALNWKLPPFFGYLWDRATTRICADGGANSVMDFLDRSPNRGLREKWPHLVVGDFDSIKPAVHERLSKSGRVKMVHIEDQDHNDTWKCITSLLSEGIREPVIVASEGGGRLDQIVGNLSVALELGKVRTFFLNSVDFATWVRQGDLGVVVKREWTTPICGLLPVAGPVDIRTRGLKWNLTGDFGLSVGDFVSSSNELDPKTERVEIKVKQPILWWNQTKPLNDLPRDVKRWVG